MYHILSCTSVMIQGIKEFCMFPKDFQIILLTKLARASLQVHTKPNLRLTTSVQWPLSLASDIALSNSGGCFSLRRLVNNIWLPCFIYYCIFHRYLLLKSRNNCEIHCI